MSEALEALGWRPHQRRALAALGDPELVPARVIARDRGMVVVHDGEAPRTTTVAGRLRHAADRGEADIPATGDWVALEGPAIAAVLPRRGVLTRDVDGAPDVIAANVDMLLVAHAFAQDEALARIPRFLALAADGDVPAVVVLTKADLMEDAGAAVAAVAEVTGAMAHTLTVSARTGEGLDAIRSLVAAGVTITLAGASGAGKSTLINALLGEERQATGEVRAHDGRGRHVTVRRELLPVPGGGLLIDTPGLRAVGVRGGVERAFDDVARVAARCRFSDCTHTTEPGCAVREAIEAGELDPARVAAGEHLAREAAHAAAREDAALQRARDRRHR